MPPKAKKQISQEQHEFSVVEVMRLAQSIAEQTFGTAWNTHAVEEITDYLEIVGDPDDFVPDLKRIYGHAQKVYKTTSPTPEQVFGLFERIYENEE